MLSSLVPADTPDPRHPPPTGQTLTQRIRLFLNHRYHVLVDRLAPIRKFLLYNTLLSSLVLMSIFTFVSFIPLLFYKTDYDQQFLLDNPRYDELFDPDYQTWLLISIFVVVPMVFEAILDFSRVRTNSIEFKNWLSRVILIAALMFPNIVLYFLIIQNSPLIDPYIPQTQFSLFLSQQIVIVGSLFGTMFEHRWDNVMNPNDRLNFSIEERTVYFLLTFTIAKVFITFSVLFSEAYTPLYILSAVLAVFAILQIVVILVRSMQFLLRQTGLNFEFKSHHHMSDFWFLFVALMFVITDFVLLLISQRLLDINPNEQIDYQYSLYVREFLYIQVCLTYFLTVIPSRAYLLHGEIQKEKLNTRLNLIRYVSHEMRTPLNTAFLGLAMLLSDLSSVAKKYKERTLALKESARHSDKSNSKPEKKGSTGKVATVSNQNSNTNHNGNPHKDAHPYPTNYKQSSSVSFSPKLVQHMDEREGVEAEVKDSSRSREFLPPPVHNSPARNAKTIDPVSFSNDEHEGFTGLATPQSHVTVIDDKKLSTLFLPKLDSNADPPAINNPIPHNPPQNPAVACTSTSESNSNLHDWFLDKRFIDIFLHGLRSILTYETLDDMMDTVNQIHESCKVALDTLNDLLMFDKIDENKLVVEVEEIDPWNLLCDTAKPFEINAREGNVEFTISCAEAASNWTFATFIKADKFKLSQVIRNLISNALKFTPEYGAVKVKLEKLPVRLSTIGEHLETNIVIRISVQDSGAGISPENQKKLFGQYVQFNAAQLQQGKGSGLGLWISRSIIEMHGGKINAYSAGEGQGSCFYIDLPLYCNDRSKSLNLFGSSIDSEESNKSFTSRVSRFTNGLGVRGISMRTGLGKLKTQPSLLNKPVIMVDNNNSSALTIGGELGTSSQPHPQPNHSTPNLIPDRKDSSFRLEAMKHQHSTLGKVPIDRHGHALLPNNAINLHVPEIKYPNIETERREEEEDDFDEFNEEEEEDDEEEGGNDGEEDDTESRKQGWLDKLSKLFSSPQPSNAQLMGKSKSRSSLKSRSHTKSAPRRSSIVRRILPSASFLSTSSSNYSLPLFVKEKKGAANPVGALEMHPSPTTPSIIDQSLPHPYSHISTISPERTPSLHLKVPSLDIDEELGINHERSSPVEKYQESYTYSLKALMEEGDDGSSSHSIEHGYQRLQSVTSQDEADEEKKNSIPVGRRSKELNDPSTFTPLVSRDNESHPAPSHEPESGRRGSHHSNHSQENNHHQHHNVAYGPGASSKKRKVRIEMSELASRSSDASPTNHNQKLKAANSKKNLETEVIPDQVMSRSPTFRSPRQPVKSWEDGLRMLIVDDSAPNRKMLHKLLASCGHIVSEAKDGVECLELLDFANNSSRGKNSRVGAIDVVLMDDHMPRMSGPETTQMLKERGFEGIIYAVTGTVDQQEIDHFLAAGVEALLAKPLNVEALKKSINEYYINQLNSKEN